MFSLIFNAQHRKIGNVGSFTTHSPDDYRPKHRSSVPLTIQPFFESMEVW